MFYGNLKNCTYTQSTTNCNAAVGFFIALIVRSFNPLFLLAEWHLYLISLVVFFYSGVNINLQTN